MEVIEAIRARRSIRAFKPTPVPRNVLEEILDASRWAPSASNGQPWHFAVLGDGILEQIKAQLEEKKLEFDGVMFKSMKPAFPRTCPWPEPLEQRRNACRASIDVAMFPPGTEDLDSKRFAWLASLLRFCDAPNAIMVLTDDPCPTGMVDIGTVSQSICLAAIGHGLGTCIMQLPTFWPEIYRDLIGIPEDRRIAVAIAIGYPDPEASVNLYSRSREPVQQQIDWHGV